MKKYMEAGKRWLALLLCFIVIFSSVEIPVHAQSVKKTLYLAAATTTKVLLEPVCIEYEYTENETTLEDVLENSGYGFVIEGGFVESIVDGESRSYYAYVDNTEVSYSVNMNPTSIGVVGYSVTDLGSNDAQMAASAQALSALVKSMADYKASKVPNILNYPPAIDAYDDGKQALVKASVKEANAAKEALDKAVEEYTKNFNSDPYTVTVTATKGTETIANPKITFTDISGNVTVSESGSVIKVVPGQYNYVIEDGGYNRIEGSLTVDGEESLTVSFADTDWFDKITPLRKDKKTPYGVTMDKNAHKAKFLIDDTADGNSVYVRVDQTADLSYGDDIEMKASYTGINQPRKISWDSTSNKLTNMAAPGMEGNTVLLKAEYKKDGYTQIQTYDVEVVRVPTLKVLEIRETSKTGTSILKGFKPEKTEYKANTVASEVYVNAVPYGEEGYTVTGTGQPYTVTDGNTLEIPVTVSHSNGQSRKYILSVSKVDAVSVTLKVPAATTVEVVNENDNVIQPQNGVYALIPGETYTYTATKGGYYHTTESFEAKEGPTVKVTEPDTKDALLAFAFHDNYYYKDRIPYNCNEAFRSDLHTYTYTVSDLYSSGAVQATPSGDYTVKAVYESQSHVSEGKHGVHTEKAIEKQVNSAANGTTLTNLLGSCAYTQQLIIRLEKVDGDVTCYQDYELEIKRSLHISSMKLMDGEDAVDLLDENGDKTYFDDEVTDYYLSLTTGTDELLMDAAFMNETENTSVCGGYYAVIGEDEYDSLKGVKLTLSDEPSQLIAITVNHRESGGVPTIFKLHVTLLDPVRVIFDTTPDEALVFMKHKRTNRVVEAVENKTYDLLPNNEYVYTVSCSGYKTKHVEDYRAPFFGGEETVQLEKAPVNTAIDATITAEWPSFRQTSDNNCIVDKKLPIAPDDTALYWATKIGDGYGKEATGCPIIVDGYIYTYAGSSIYKVDSVDGKILATGKMVAGSNFAINPPTYAEGMIFVGLSDGRVQAFNAKTLESLWVFKDEIGGQPNCSITYKDGYIYTGFWKGETQNANYVCISVTDEDPSSTTEQKLPSWSYTGAGGFYWAGAYITDNYILIGTDDGKSGYLRGFGHVLSIDYRTGRVIDDLTLPNVGDVRCDMTYYEGKFYFTSKGGYLYEISVDESGDILEDTLRYVKLSNGKEDADNPAMSTSTPTIYNGRVYIGASGTGQFESYSGHNITVIDLKAWEIAYSVPTQGYPQTSGLLTTAYEEETGAVYVYFFDNDTPGKLRVIKDEAGQTRPSEVIEESYMINGSEKMYETAPVLFTPAGEHAQYALCSPIVDEYGTIYFKNDSACLMALGSRIDKIEVTKQPDKLNYLSGDTFDPTGIVVTATYANGLERDVTSYISYSKDPLTSDDKDFAIRFKHSLYQNKDGQAGVKCEELMDLVQITVSSMTKVEAKAPTCTEDGNIEHWLDVETGKRYADMEATKELAKEAVIIPKGHKEAAVPLVPATFTADGKTAGSQCQVCGAAIIPQQTIGMVKATLSGTAFVYNGKEQTPTVSVTSGATVLTEGVDYSLTYSEGRMEYGTYTVTVTLMGTNYVGTTELSYEITPNAKITLSKKAYTYNGKAQKPKVTVRTLGKGKKKLSSKYYTISYAKGRKKVGIYTVTVKLKNGYSGVLKETFVINPKGTSLSKLTAGKKRLTVKWKKQTKETSGYEIRYSTVSSMKKAKTVIVSGKGKTSKTIKGLKAKKKYYVQIRTYKTLRGQKYYSSWSAKKTVKIK